MVNNWLLKARMENEGRKADTDLTSITISRKLRDKLDRMKDDDKFSLNHKESWNSLFENMIKLLKEQGLKIKKLQEEHQKLINKVNFYEKRRHNW